MKTCTKCGKPEGVVEFSRYRRGASMQKRSACKGCCRQGYRAHDATRREAKRAYSKAYYRGHTAYFQAYYKENKAGRNAQAVACNKVRRHERYAKIQALKEANPCADCKQGFPYFVMDFDHRDPAQKLAGVSDLVKTSPWGRVEAEIAKCDLVCACCHRLRTYNGRNTYTSIRFRQHQAVLDELKSSVPCLDCQRFFKPCQMDFDHLHSKVANVARLVAGPSGPLEEELRKCQLVCANCHRIRGNTGIRPENFAHGEMLAALFEIILSATPPPRDARAAPFPLPQLLGTISDKELAQRTGISREMVAWHRRKKGIRLSTSGKRVDALEVVT